MVCVYCSAETNVINSRHQKRTNSVWRRRQCTACKAVFTSIEKNVYENSLSFKHDKKSIAPFMRDILFVSIYDACRHRHDAISDATALTDTILGEMQHSQSTQGIIERNDLIQTASNVLRRFDTAAYVHYQAYHRLLSEI
jgi:transcriptional regulator NrdR family protein